MKSRSRALYEKSLSAMLAAIEIYNKPDFFYREEVFSILATNGWELLLKARILQLDHNRIQAITEYERKKKKDGTRSRRWTIKTNRSGNRVSIGLLPSLKLLTNKYGDDIDEVLRRNLILLVEIRDNSVHFFNKDSELCKSVLEIGTAALSNYVVLSRKWFGVDLGAYNFYMMPIAFVRDFHTVKGLALNKEEGRLLDLIRSERASAESVANGDFSLSLEIDVRLKRTSGESQAEFRLTNDPSATPIRIEELKMLETYPWDYKHLTAFLRRRYSDFLQNQDYHTLRKKLETRPEYCKERLLDPSNPESLRKKFYNSNIVKEFDKHYTRP